MSTPMTIRIYDATDNYTEHNRAFVPWGILKAAIRLYKKVGKKSEEDISEEDLDAIAALVVEAFGNKFSISDLDQGCDVSEVLAVFYNIVARAQGTRPNGLPPVG